MTVTILSETGRSQRSSKFTISRSWKGVWCSFLTICVLVRTTYKATARTIMLTILPAEFSSHQCVQRSFKLEKSWTFGNDTGSGHQMSEGSRSEFVEMVSVHRG